jgi:hypothetical protein
MSDIFREVDEEIRHERYKRLWDRFGSYLIAVAILIVVGTAAYRGWLYWRETAARESGDVFVTAVRLADEGKFAEAEAQLAGLADAPGGYPALARMRGAALKGEAGDPAAAMAAFDMIADDGREAPLLRDIARLRAGYLALDLEDYAGAVSRLEVLSGDDNAWRFLAREGLALAAWKQDDTAAARRWIGGIVDQEGAPGDVVSRARTLLELIDAAEGKPDEESKS